MSDSVFRYCARLLRRQLVLAWRRPLEMGNPLLFFCMVLVLFPLGLGPAPEQLAQFAPGILWIIALLASLLTAESLFRSDFTDGSLEQMLLSGQPLYFSGLTYLLAHWLVAGLPLSLISPLFALMLGLPAQGLVVLVAGLLIGTALLSLIGGIGAALTVGLHRGGVLLSLLVIPLYVPVLIFGSAVVADAASGAAVGGYLAILGGLLCIAIALAPLAVAAGLRISADS